jgi:hypothetical protein
MTSTPAVSAVRTTARRVAFIPEQSPPLVNTAIRFIDLPFLFGFLNEKS